MDSHRGLSTVLQPPRAAADRYKATSTRSTARAPITSAAGRALFFFFFFSLLPCRIHISFSLCPSPSHLFHYSPLPFFLRGVYLAARMYAHRIRGGREVQWSTCTEYLRGGGPLAVRSAGNSRLPSESVPPPLDQIFNIEPLWPPTHAKKARAQSWSVVCTARISFVGKSRGLEELSRGSRGRFF